MHKGIWRIHNLGDSEYTWKLWRVCIFINYVVMAAVYVTTVVQTEISVARIFEFTHSTRSKMQLYLKEKNGYGTIEENGDVWCIYHGKTNSFNYSWYLPDAQYYRLTLFMTKLYHVSYPNMKPKHNCFEISNVTSRWGNVCFNRC